jgi:Flp pilus assembly protein TadG
MMNIFKRFAKAEKGTVGVTLALSIVPLLVAAGVGIDMARFTNVHSQMQVALDAGAVAAAAAKGKTSAQRVAIGEDAFKANIDSGLVSTLSNTVSYKVVGKTIQGRVDANMPTTLLAVAGLNDIDVGASTEVTIPDDKKAEIALVLDYSGSMEDVSGSEVKYIAMRDAATKLIDDITKDNADKVKFALVPFSHHVYTSLPNAFVLGKGTSGTWTGCTQDRQYPYNLTDATPDGSNPSKWGQANAPDHAAYGCSGYKSRNLVVKPLTADFGAVKSQLNAMKPYAYTHVALGVEFGYQVLSPNAPYSEGVSYTDKGTNKYMVVLTDGAQTEPAFGPGGIRTVDQGDENLVALCNNAKASGITMITVAFDLDDSSQRARLKSCATDPAKNFFVANSSEDVAQAFDEITNAITATAFLSK